MAVGIIHSADLVKWEYVGGAMPPLLSEPPYYWAPEVTYHNGEFYLYYSCGNETLMEIRVAVSDRPDGGFVDSGRRLTFEDFAIDAHVFRDDDGQRYLFYATDFLDHTHIGTGTVVDRMIDWFRLEGKPRPVTRAAYDWQVYHPNRPEKGGVRWHTVEGPTVFKHKRKYFEMFSGGNWQNDTYGVGYATSDKIVRDLEWDQLIDGSSLLPVLRTIPGKVLGPGHNSAIVGPNGRELFCVYHTWVGDERVMALDRMGFAGQRLFVHGPTTEPQSAPFRPSLTFDETERYRLTGAWERSGSSLRNQTAEASKVEVETGGRSFLADFWMRFVHAIDASAGATVALEGDRVACRIHFALERNHIVFSTAHGDRTIELPDELDWFEFQHVRLEVEGPFVQLGFGEHFRPVSIEIGSEVERLVAETAGCQLEIAGFGLTCGFEDLFDRSFSYGSAGWRVLSGDAELSFENEELLIIGSALSPSVIAKGRAADNFEYVVNIRTSEGAPDRVAYGFAVLDAECRKTRELLLSGMDGQAVMSDTLSGVHLPLPKDLQTDKYRQFRFVKFADRLRIESEDSTIGELKIDNTAAMIGILTRGGSVALELVRWTEI